MPALSLLLLLGFVPLLLESPDQRQAVVLVTALCAALLLLHRLGAWAVREVQLDVDTRRARALGAFARALADGRGAPGRLTRLGRSTLVTGMWRGRPLRVVCDRCGRLSWEVVAPGHAVDLLVRPRWPGLPGWPRAVRGGVAHVWRLPRAGRAEALALRLVAERRAGRIELSGELLRAEVAPGWRALEMDRLLAVTQTLVGIADLLAPAGRAGLPPAWREARPASRCPFCRDALRGGLPAWDCPACGTAHHPVCAREAGGCTVLGCSAAAPLRRAGRPPDRAWKGP